MKCHCEEPERAKRMRGRRSNLVIKFIGHSYPEDSGLRRHFVRYASKPPRNDKYKV